MAWATTLDARCGQATSVSDIRTGNSWRSGQSWQNPVRAKTEVSVAPRDVGQLAIFPGRGQLQWTVPGGTPSSYTLTSFFRVGDSCKTTSPLYH